MRALTLLIVAAALLSCRTTTPAEARTAQELFQMIEVGIPRQRVETLLGPPVLPELAPGEIAWYLRSPKIEAWQSPFAPGSIGITYSADGKVASKLLNPQVTKR